MTETSLLRVNGLASVYPARGRTAWILAQRPPRTAAPDPNAPHGVFLEERLASGEVVASADGYASGLFGPTTAGRMDLFVDEFQAAAGSLVMLAKGNRSAEVRRACAQHGGFLIGSIGGPAARLAQDCIRHVEVLEYPELGMEVIWRIEVENFPAFVVIDDKGERFLQGVEPRLTSLVRINPLLTLFVVAALAGCAAVTDNAPIDAHAALDVAAVPLDPAAATAMLNAYRASQISCAVWLDPALTAMAQRQADAMAASNQMSHDVAGNFPSRLAASGVHALRQRKISAAAIIRCKKRWTAGSACPRTTPITRRPSRR